MSKKKILIVENSIDVTGALKSITRTAYDLKDYFDFEFIVPQHSKGRFWIEGKGFDKIYELPLKEINKSLGRLLVYLPFLFLNAFRLKRIVKQKEIDILHVNDIYNLLPIMLRLLGCSVPYVCHIRFMPDRFPRWLFAFWLRLHLRYAQKIVVVSKSVLQQLPNHPKFQLIYNELPVEERYPNGLEKPKEDEYTFLYLSNFMMGKGQNFAIEAFSKVSKQLPNWSIRFVGGTMGLLKNMQFEEKIKKRASELNVFEKTQWQGFTEEVEREYKQADIVLNFSESESFSITCVETLFFGRPLVVTNCGGPAEIVDHEETGLIVANRNVEAMAAAMIRLAENKNERELMAECAKRSVRHKFSVDNTSLLLKKVYERALIS